jgi:UDP-N-acetylmuramyl pentapeptide phosphotransferase/UDP-N-acetylglucosamine-1-phosphate transferase
MKRVLIGGVLGAAAARAAYTALTRRPPGLNGLPGDEVWGRTNHRGEPVTLLEGPAFVAGATAAGLVAPGISTRMRAAVLLAGAGGGLLGAYDDLAGSGDSRGFKGHLSALARGEVTSGSVKLLGIGAAGLASAAVAGTSARSKPVAVIDILINGALVAGGANLLNLFDLRPGRAIKVGLMAGVPLAAGAPWRSAGQAVEVGGAGRGGRRGRLVGESWSGNHGRGIMVGESWSGNHGRGSAAAVVAAPLGAAFALLPEDLGERAMLGDAGANALGALMGLAATRLGRGSRLAVLAAVVGLTGASEVVSFTKVIQSTPPLHWLDMLGRRPVPARQEPDPSQ